MINKRLALTLAIPAMLFVSGCASDTEETEPETQEEVTESEETPDDELQGIIDNSGTQTEKLDEVYSVAKDHAENLSIEEANDYLQTVVSDYQSGDFEANSLDTEYAVSRMFEIQSARLFMENEYEETQDDALMTKVSLLTDFEQVLKYTYREVDTWDSPDTVANLEQIDETLTELDM